MIESNFLAGAKAALGDLLEGEELLELGVSGGWGNRLIVAEELPGGDRFEVEFLFH